MDSPRLAADRLHLLHHHRRHPLGRQCFKMASHADPFGKTITYGGGAPRLSRTCSGCCSRESPWPCSTSSQAWRTASPSSASHSACKALKWRNCPCSPSGHACSTSKGNGATRGAAGGTSHEPLIVEDIGGSERHAIRIDCSFKVCRPYQGMTSENAYDPSVATTR